MPTTVLLIRHPESAWNRQGIYQGQIDTPLSPLGRTQAELVARRLRSRHIDAVVCSPLHRARALAAAIARYHRLRPIVDRRLIEISHGPWEGMSRHDVEAAYPDLFHSWQAEPHTVTFPDGESLQDVHDRAVDAVTEILAEPGDRTVAVVTHDAVARLVIAAAQHRPLIGFSDVTIDNAGISTLVGPDLAGSLRHMNDVTHLGTLRVNLGGQAL